MIKTGFFTAFLGACTLFSYAQTATTFAGKVNTTDPWTNFNNTTTTPANAYFYEPEGIAWDKNGRMYITERNKVRLYDGTDIYNRSGALGDATFSIGYANGTGIAAEYYHPISIVCDGNGNSFIVDAENHAIRKLTPFVNPSNGQVASTFAGAAPNNSQGTSGYTDGTGTAARFNTPKGVTMDASGNMYVTDYNNYCIRKITAAGVVTTLAGKGGEDGTTDGTGGANSRFGGPYGIAVLDANHVVITDNWNLTIRKVNITSGSTTTLCGKNGVLGTKDGSLSEATFKSPKGIAVVNGLIYVADGSRIRVIDLTNQTVSTFAGSLSEGNEDGIGDKAKFGRLAGLAYNGTNALFVTDIYFNIIRKVTIDNLAPACDFKATKTSLLVNEEATITDISGGKPATGRKWVVKEQSGSTSNVVIVSGDLNSSSSITVKFSATGFYTVSLNVTNEYGADSKEKAPYFNVSTTGNVEQLENLDKLTVYPNPLVGNKLHMELENGYFNDAVIELFDTRGGLINRLDNVSGTSCQFDTPDLAPGAYFIVIHSSSFNGAKRIVVQ